jgi:ferredoxin
MMIHVDRSKCQGHALCAAAAPGLYTLDDDGYSDVDEVEVPAGMEGLARRGVMACPERAITLDATEPTR